MSSPFYPEDISGRALCYMEGCVGKGNCPRCGEMNYHLLGFYGAIAKWARVWGVSEDEAETRICQHQEERWNRGVARVAKRLNLNAEGAQDFLYAISFLSPRWVVVETMER